ncbi:MAG: hypothetical protein LBB24_00590, partial [Rickettsiales bacterium]|nr:hypothetical protein [Rickettsiales bacterium]
MPENKVRRDFGELANLQNSRKNSAFAAATIRHIGDKLYNFFTEKRPNYSLVVDGYKNWEGRGENSVYVNTLCGANNFLHAVPYFATLLTLKRSGEILMGFVNCYSTGETFFVSKGSGAFLNDRRIRVSSRTMEESTLVSVKCDRSSGLFEKLLPKFGPPRVTGCYPLDICYTACGRYDACVVMDGDEEELKLGKLLITEAGGLH